MRDVEVAIGETPESDSRYTSLLKEYDQSVKDDFNEQNGYGYENEIRSVLHGFKLMRAFMIKKLAPYPVDKKPVLPWHECYWSNLIF